MSEARLPQAPARKHPEAPPLDVLGERIEEELARLREARPILDARIDRAATIVVVQLSSSPRTRPIKCRIRRGGKRVLLVASLRAGGVTYEVCPENWTCSCPDFHRKGTGCKHGIAAWTLWRVSLPREVQAHVDRIDENARVLVADHARAHDDDEEGEQPCPACEDSGWIHLDEDIVDPKTGETSKATNPVRCRSCKPATPPHLSDEEMREWMDSTRWRFARTMPKHPHEYSLRGWNDEDLFERVVKTIWDRGYDRPYLSRVWRSLDVGEFYAWIAGAPPRPEHPAPVKETDLINRARRVQDELGEAG